MSQYSFPVLKFKEILLCLRELDISLTTDELKEPKEEKMKVVYEKFLEHLMGVTVEDLRQPQFAAMDAFQYPELHEESIVQLSLYKALLELMTSVGLHDATISDFANPSAARTKRILSGLINFAKFREERLVAYTEYTQQSEQLIDVRRQIELENATLESTLAEMSAKREKDLPLIQQLEAETTELEDTITEANKNHTSLRQDASTLKEKISDCGEKVASAKFSIANTKQQMDKIRSQIIKDPEQLKLDLTVMAENIAAKKKNISESRATMHKLSKEMENFEKVNNKLKKRIDSMKECDKKLTDKRATHKAIKENVSKIAGKEEEVSVLTAAEEELSKQIGSMQDKIFRLQRQFESKRHAAHMAMEQVNGEKLAVIRNVGQDKAAIDRAERELLEKRRELEDMQKQHEEEMQTLRKKFEGFSSELSGYHNRLATAMGVTHMTA